MEPLTPFMFERELPHKGRLFIAPMRIPDVVTIEGSVLAGPNFLPKGQSEIANLTASLLDAGTKKKTKTELRGAVADRGAQLTFRSEGDRTHFYATCLPDDVTFMLSLIGECLGESVIPANELSLASQKRLSEITEAASDTRTQAREELQRLLFDASHVHYEDTTAVRRKTLHAATRTDLIGFKKQIGSGGLVLAITGDVTERVANAAERVFGRLSEGTIDSPTKQANTKAPQATEKHIVIAGKANVDVFLGASLPLRFGEPMYLPMSLLVNMLGGGFAAHLMQTVRDRDGLTYGIRAMLCGTEPDTDGFFRIWSTFSPELYEKGVAAIHKEVRAFLNTRLKEEALRRTKEELAGSYAIELSTTGGLAHALHTLGTRGLPLSYLDAYPSLVQSVSLKEIKEAAHMIPLDALSLAAAGTFKKG